MNPQELFRQEQNVPEKEGMVAEDILDREAFLSKKELIMEKYEDVINWREKKYNQDIAEEPSREGMRFDLDVHNRIVLDYAIKLIEVENLGQQEKVEAIMATIMHDGGKLSSNLLEHHEKGVEYAGEMLKEMIGKKIDGIEITKEIAQKIKEAIDRHMNHPFVVMMNKGNEFPVPKDNVDKVVFDADMLANIGFKNVAFRIKNEGFLEKDFMRAKDGNVLEESFRNVLEGEITNDGKKIPGASGLKDVMLSDSAKKMADKLIEDAEKIFENLKKNGTIIRIQNFFSDNDGNFNPATIKERGGAELVKKLLNEEIEKSAMELGIETIIAEKFKM